MKKYISSSIYIGSDILFLLNSVLKYYFPQAVKVELSAKNENTEQKHLITSELSCTEKNILLTTIVSVLHKNIILLRNVFNEFCWGTHLQVFIAIREPHQIYSKTLNCAGK